MWHIHKKRTEKEKGENVENHLVTAANVCQSHRLHLCSLLICSSGLLSYRPTRTAAIIPRLHRGREKKNVLPDTKLCLHNENEANFEPLESGRQAALSRRAKANPGASSLAHNSLKTWRGITNSWSNR